MANPRTAFFVSLGILLTLAVGVGIIFLFVYLLMMTIAMFIDSSRIPGFVLAAFIYVAALYVNTGYAMIGLLRAAPDLRRWTDIAFVSDALLPLVILWLGLLPGMPVPDLLYTWNPFMLYSGFAVVILALWVPMRAYLRRLERVGASFGPGLLPR